MSKIKGLFEIYKATTTVDDEDFLPKEMEVKIHDDRNGNGDDVFKGKNIKYIKRQKGKDNHGFDAGKDLKAAQKFDRHKDIPDMTTYSQKSMMATEEVEQIDESIKDGYWVTNSQSELTHKEPFTDSNAAKRHADKLEIKSGKQHQVHHVKDGKTCKSWSSECDMQGPYWKMHKDWAGERFHHAGIAEEVEQIDELSNDTLGQYIRKSAGQMATNAMAAGVEKNKGNQKAVNATLLKALKRQHGIGVAVKKIVKENMKEAEQIDELSKNLLGRYIKASKSDIRYAGKQYVRSRQDNDEKEKRYADKLAQKRYKGVNMAVDKLTKEEVIDSVFETYINDKLVSIDPLERLEENLSSLSNKNLELIVNLFNELTEENQYSLIELTESKEGIDELLDYIINGQ